MKSKGVVWGVLLVAIGLLFVLRNLGYFYLAGILSCGSGR